MALVNLANPLQNCNSMFNNDSNVEESNFILIKDTLKLIRIDKNKLTFDLWATDAIINGKKSLLNLTNLNEDISIYTIIVLIESRHFKLKQKVVIPLLQMRITIIKH